ncbi:hypothetical protein D9613_012835 [Agrocybe pediades]|uniref:NACHT domain-containing protein n=1 Tax=Agrocybe pediades TaxID=84607 RepID=A0A8H4VVC0_9AGAR|nr:hypothetical protein D9613_012835 [Agrocybe pediades]
MTQPDTPVPPPINISHSILQNPTFLQHNHIDQRQYIVSGERPGYARLLEHVATSALHDSVDNVDPPKCHPNTRVAIIQNIRDWALGTDEELRGKPILWLKGAAGAGKSAIARSLIVLEIMLEGSLPPSHTKSILFSPSSETRAFAFFQQHVAALGGNEESDAAYGVRLWARLLVNLVPLADGPLHSKWDAVLGAWSPFSFETCQLYPVEEASFREAVTMSDFPLTLSGPYAKEEDLPPPSLASPLAPDTTGPPVLAPSVQAVAPVPAPAVVPEQVTRANTPLVPLSPAVLPFTPTAPAIATLAQPDSTIISPGSSRRPSVGSQSTPLFLAPPGSYVGKPPASSTHIAVVAHEETLGAFSPDMASSSGSITSLRNRPAPKPAKAHPPAAAEVAVPKLGKGKNHRNHAPAPPESESDNEIIEINHPEDEVEEDTLRSGRKRKRVDSEVEVTEVRKGKSKAPVKAPAKAFGKKVKEEKGVTAPASSSVKREGSPPRHTIQKKSRAHQVQKALLPENRSDLAPVPTMPLPLNEDEAQQVLDGRRPHPPVCLTCTVVHTSASCQYQGFQKKCKHCQSSKYPWCSFEGHSADHFFMSHVVDELGQDSLANIRRLVSALNAHTAVAAPLVQALQASYKERLRLLRELRDIFQHLIDNFTLERVRELYAGDDDSFDTLWEFLQKVSDPAPPRRRLSARPPSRQHVVPRSSAGSSSHRTMDKTVEDSEIEQGEGAEDDEEEE